MAINAANTYDNVNPIREELADMIWDVSPTETPFVSNCSKISVDNTIFEWQTDTLAPVSTSVAAEGADATFTDPDDTVRLKNYCEIITKTAAVSGTVDVVNNAGMGRQMAYQIVKRGKEAKRDMEHHAVGLHNPYNAGNASGPTARETASVQCYIATNTNMATAGSPANPAGTGADAPTAGTAHVFTEAYLEDVIDKIFNQGGNPDVIMAGSFNKRKITGFSGNADNRDINATGKKIINAVSVYESDYGTMKVVPNRFLKSSDVLVYESDYWKIAQLRPMFTKDIAATGDATKKQIVVEWGVCAANEKSSGIIRDLTTS